jgi:hypothetical protein
MRADVCGIGASEIMSRFGVSRTTAWRAAKRGWICRQREATAPMTEDDGREVLEATRFVWDDDLRSNAILRCVELWRDILAAENRKQYMIRIALTEIRRRRTIRI